MIKCRQCGGKLHRIHRTLSDRFRYLAIFRCSDCQAEAFVPRPYIYRMGPHGRCPKCGATRLSRLKERDRIDKMQGGLWNLFERLAGGKLLHCRICRLQFYDRRILASEAQAPAQEQSQPNVSTT